MAKFVLVHGAWHGAWCWERLTPILQAAGHEVIIPDLPGMGADAATLAKMSLTDWTNAVLDAIRQSFGPAILVGHSGGGVPISAAAEAAPELVSRLIYLTAIVLADGQSGLDAVGPGGLPLKIEIDPGQRSCSLAEPDIARRFYADCSDADIIFARARLRTEPLFALMTPVRLTDKYARISRDYIECMLDQAISIEMQRRMQAVWPMQRVKALDTSHSPFFSAPEALAAVLTELAVGPAGI